MEAAWKRAVWVWVWVQHYPLRFEGLEGLEGLDAQLIITPDCVNRCARRLNRL